MTSPFLRRSKPLLGTFVEITVRARSEQGAILLSNHAFDVITRVEQKMSRFDTGSDIAALNRHEHPVVDPWTADVLDRAEELRIKSHGRFNIRVGGLIDLGGFAKGFAVDKALDTLKSGGATAAMVNAGGDMAVFGDPWTVHVRHPNNPTELLGAIHLNNQALASSGRPFDPTTGTMATECATLDPATGRPALGALGATVLADNACLADGLTKIAMIDGPKSMDFIRSCGASALIIDPFGRTHISDHQLAEIFVAA